jgi:galactokinase
MVDERDAVPTFSELFGRPPAVVAGAPGRVNLVGEHTDYNDGFVLPTAIPRTTRIALAPRDDRQVRVASAYAGGEPRAYTLGTERRDGTWLDYVRGITWAVADTGERLRGFDALVTSTVPAGSGLASSAALEVALVRALREAYALAFDDVAVALRAHRAEHDFVGARVGVMDQMAASLADRATALFLDTRTLRHERVPLPARAELAVVHSGLTHHHAAGAYNARRAECERAAALLGVPALRDLGGDALARAAGLPEPLDRRVRHVVTENARVLAAVAALRAGDLPALGRLFLASHASMRDDYEVSAPDVDLLVALAAAESGVHGARLTGGGFGGCVVLLAEAGTARAAAERAAARYAARSGRRPAVLVP